MNREGKYREETCMPESSPERSQGHMKSTNPHWASVVDCGLKPSHSEKRPVPSSGPTIKYHLTDKDGPLSDLAFQYDVTFLCDIVLDSVSVSTEQVKLWYGLNITYSLTGRQIAIKAEPHSLTNKEWTVVL
ncbi:jg27155 [Pararge aegeria aegeria]|uniref:Jg27155 protein n=1 Tax=Pararge aegeria aegeria TaxID=348720 RepID=A0A8S4QI21_9NEOP|nr:jg27155 [Pararge aegeria aegeria]